MRRITLFVIIAVAMLINYSCSLFGGGADEPGPAQLTVTVEPENGGNVNITSRTFTEGDSVTVSANSNKGFSFIEWRGTRQSDLNPFSFVIQSDTDLTASFLATSSDYRVNFFVADNSNTVDLQFGQKDGASEDFDNGLDFESPPPPPQDALHAYFQTGSIEFLRDFRNSEVSSATWVLEIQPGTSDSLTFTWSISEVVLNGPLTLNIPDLSQEIDMTEATEVKIHKNEINNLSIDYVLNQ